MSCGAAAASGCAALVQLWGQGLAVTPEPNETECRIEAMPEPFCHSRLWLVWKSHLVPSPVCPVAFHPCPALCEVRLAEGFGCWKEVLGCSGELGKFLSFFLNFNFFQDLPHVVHGDCKTPVVGGRLGLPWVQIPVMEQFSAVGTPGSRSGDVLEG